MRLTNVLLQVNYKRHFERIWKRQGRLKASELKVPEVLQEMGVDIMDAREILYETNTFPRKDKSKPIIPSPPSVFNRKKYFFVMNDGTHVSESENQVLSLTKTLPYSGLPIELNSLVGVCSLPNQDELVQTSILQAHLWDSYQDKEPGKICPVRLGYVLKRTYGILYERKVTSLLEKLNYLCEGAIGKYPACLQRDKVNNAICNLAVERNGESVTFQMPCDVLITSKEPLKRFASEDDVAATKHQEVPNIYPIKHTLDLEKFDEKPVCASPRRMNNSSIHTLFIGHKSYDIWSPSELLSRAIATCFTFCAKEAQIKYGVDVMKLPDPVTVQCAYMDLNSFNFIAYQLNTLELDHNDGIKNQAWIDEPVTLFDEVSAEKLISNYNPAVFPKLLSFYVNGLHPSS